MNSNRLNNIFRKRHLSRKDIEVYKNSADELEKNKIEQAAQSDPFQSDAMEGWEAMNYNTQSLNRLDKKFSSTSSNAWYFIIGGVAVCTIPLFFFLFSEKNKVDKPIEVKDETSLVTTLNEDQQITLDETDIIIREEIDKMESAPKQQQLQPKNIQSDFKEMNEAKLEAPELPIVELPLIDIDPQTPEAKEIIRKHELAKEMYLHDLKLVDYRAYREKPQVKTKQMVLTGTPADQENEDSPTLDPIWKDVDVPYIEFIDKSMRIFENGNFKRALARFETIIETYPIDVNANFYAGVCLYNLKEYKLAIVHFDQCIFGPYSNFDEEANWMKALSLEKIGKKEQAKKIFQEIIELDGFYANQAKEKIK